MLILVEVIRDNVKVKFRFNEFYITCYREFKNKTMKLELKHLAPYLPYGLKVILKSTDNNTIPRIFSITLLYSYSNDINDIKPILRPLTDLTEEIEVKGHSAGSFKTCTLDQLNGMMSMEDEFESIHKRSMVLTYPYEAIQLLLEYHFDVFGLIDKGLAIDINTLEE